MTNEIRKLVLISPVAFKTKDAAAYLGIDESTFRRMVAPDMYNKDFKPVYYGRYQRAIYPREVLDAYLKQCSSKPKLHKCKP